jgi:hypothetical protein
MNRARRDVPVWPKRHKGIKGPAECKSTNRQLIKSNTKGILDLMMIKRMALID